jgi:hypothetical protein
MTQAHRIHLSLIEEFNNLHICEKIAREQLLERIYTMLVDEATKHDAALALQHIIDNQPSLNSRSATRDVPRWLQCNKHLSVTHKGPIPFKSYARGNIYRQIVMDFMMERQGEVSKIMHDDFATTDTVNNRSAEQSVEALIPKLFQKLLTSRTGIQAEVQESEKSLFEDSFRKEIKKRLKQARFRETGVPVRKASGGITIRRNPRNSFPGHDSKGRFTVGNAVQRRRAGIRSQIAISQSAYEILLQQNSNASSVQANSE